MSITLLSVFENGAAIHSRSEEFRRSHVPKGNVKLGPADHPPETEYHQVRIDDQKQPEALTPEKGEGNLVCPSVQVIYITIGPEGETC
jgi:hypothetical protein